ncbi:MBL fold metallo-hydrolase [Blautia schinkii]|nr:MBL fold metallo-hydrolase [Blautia schinkii]
MKNKIMVLAGWLIFLGLLTSVLLLVKPKGKQVNQELRVICIQTRKDADCTLLVQDNTAIMIDTGEKQDAYHIMEIMRENEVRKLDYLILSHSDKDHVGGAQDILKEFPVDCVVESGFEAVNDWMLELNALIREQDGKILYPGHTRRLQAGGIQLLVYPPLEKNYNDSNNYSLGVLIRHGKVNMLFPGDALRKRSEELLNINWPEIEFYKVPHHGRANTGTEDLFDKISPQFAVVTSKDADEEVKEAAERNHTELYYTGERDWIFSSNGEELIQED